MSNASAEAVEATNEYMDRMRSEGWTHVFGTVMDFNPDDFYMPKPKESHRRRINRLRAGRVILKRMLREAQPPRDHPGV